jgi:hypothetical protein
MFNIYYMNNYNNFLLETAKAQDELEILTSLVIESIAFETFEFHQKNVWLEPNKGLVPSDVNFKSYKMESESYIVDFSKGKYKDDFENGSYLIETFKESKVKFFGFDETFDVSELEMTWNERANSVIKMFNSTNLFKLSKVDNPKINKISEMKEFINNFDCAISLSKENGNIKGSFAPYSFRSGYIELNTDKKRLLHEVSMTKRRDGTYDYKDLYFTLYLQFASTLLHELQHAYDWYRSKGKAIKHSDKNAKREGRKKELVAKGYSEHNEEEREFMNDFHKEYQNQPHEIDARFTQAIKETNFYKMDDDFNKVIIPLRDVFKSFTVWFDGWKNLSYKDRKRLSRRLSQFWHIKKDSIENGVNEDVATGGVAVASASTTSGMGNVVAAQPSSTPGSVAGSTSGSGDYGFALGSTAVYPSKYKPSKTDTITTSKKDKKKKKKKSITKIDDFMNTYGKREKSEVKTMSFQNFIKNDINKIKK